MHPLLCLAAVLGAAAPAGRELAVDLWDWTPPCRDLAIFRRWVADLKSIGATRVEISAPWRLLEPRPGEHDLTFIAERLAIVEEAGLGLRVRINSYYSGATPDWLECDRWMDAQGKPAADIPSITDARFWERYAPLCTAIARRFRGRGVQYSPFIGVHAELKWSDWWSYDRSTLASWRTAIGARPRAAWLARIVGGADLPERPPVPGPTAGAPDLDAANRAWIAFREECWREAVRRFVAAIRAGDARAAVSVPLGESYRRESAAMSNLDYRGLSRGAAHVQHSYDFFWHAGQDPWQAAASVAAFRGITRLPVSLEIDGPVLFQQFGYREEDLLRIAEAALGTGAMLKVANFSYLERLPSSWPFMVELGRRAAAVAAPVDPPPADTVLLFVSKWANYLYREPTQWLHDAQFGAWRMLTAAGYPVRVVCEDNLAEGLGRYRGLYVAFSPPELMPEADRRALDRLARRLPSVTELARAPLPGEDPEAVGSCPAGAFAAWAPGLPAHVDGPAAPAVDGRRVALGYPLAYVWLRGADRAAQERVLGWACARSWGPPRGERAGAR